MKIAIVDDSVIIAENVKERLKVLFSINNVEFRIFFSGDEFLQSGYYADYLFLDIAMPNMDGIDVRIRCEKKYPGTRIIFLTAMTSRMQAAFGKNVVAFLSKPLNEKDLKGIVLRIEKSQKGKSIEFDLNEKHYVILVQDILYIEACDKYSYLVTIKHEKFCLRKTLKEWEKELPTGMFCRINKSYIINYGMCEDGCDSFRLSNQDVRVSRLYRNKLKEGYRQYLFLKLEGNVF